MRTALCTTEGLHIEDVDGECVVYASATDTVHCLDATARTIFVACEGRTAEQVVEATGFDGGTVTAHVEDFVRRGLVTREGSSSATVGRRALVGVAAAGVGVWSIVAPAPSEAASQAVPVEPRQTMAFSYDLNDSTLDLVSVTTDVPLSSLAVGESTTLSVEIANPDYWFNPDPNSPAFAQSIVGFALKLSGLEIGSGAFTIEDLDRSVGKSWIYRPGFEDSNAEGSTSYPVEVRNQSLRFVVHIPVRRTSSADPVAWVHLFGDGLTEFGVTTDPSDPAVVSGTVLESMKVS